MKKLYIPHCFSPSPEHFNGVLELVAQRLHEAVPKSSRIDVNP